MQTLCEWLHVVVCHMRLFILFPLLVPSVPEPLNVTMQSPNIYRLVWNRPNLVGDLAKVEVSLEWRIKHLGKIDRDKKVIPVGKNFRSRTRRDITFDWKAEVKDYGSKRVLDLMDLFPNTIYKVSVSEGLDIKGKIMWSGAASTKIETPEGGNFKLAETFIVLTTYFKSRNQVIYKVSISCSQNVVIYMENYT